MRLFGVLFNRKWLSTGIRSHTHPNIHNTVIRMKNRSISFKKKNENESVKLDMFAGQILIHIKD